jgi:hypothetical protein
MYRPAHITKAQAEAGAAEWDAHVKAEGHKPASIATLNAAFDIFLEVSKRQKGQIETLERRLAEAESRLSLAEARPELKFVGPYRVGESYSAGCFVQKNSGLWLAERLTSAMPGQPDSGWRLVVKEGRAQA